MKNKIFKLFLAFWLIVLSLFVFASCNDGVPKNPEDEIKASDLKPIEDDELVKFVLFNLPKRKEEYSRTYLEKLYEHREEDQVLEFEVSKTSETICFYITPSTIEKIVDKNSLSFDESYSFRKLLFRYATEFVNNRIDVKEDKLQLYTANGNKIPFIHDENVLIYVCELYTLSFNDGSTAAVILNHDGEIRFPKGDTGEAYFKSEQKFESISSFIYKSQKCIMPKSRLSQYMWSNAFLKSAIRIEYIDDVECLRYSPGLCEDFLDAIADLNTFSVSAARYISYSDVKELLKIK